MIAMINLAPQNAVCFEMSGYLVWDGTTYNFDERHTDKAIQANIMRCKYLMYKELSRYFDIFEVFDIPGIVGTC